MNHFDTHMMLEYHRQRLHETMAQVQRENALTRITKTRSSRPMLWILAILCLLAARLITG
jgi:hypothetical protein